MDISTLKPQYAELKFKTSADFKKWLEETTAYTVRFFDDGQDLIMLHVAENNEVIHADYGAMAGIYAGSFIVEEPKEFHYVKLYALKGKPQPYYIRFQVSEVTYLKDNLWKVK